MDTKQWATNLYIPSLAKTSKTRNPKLPNLRKKLGVKIYSLSLIWLMMLFQEEVETIHRPKVREAIIVKMKDNILILNLN